MSSLPKGVPFFLVYGLDWKQTAAGRDRAIYDDLRNVSEKLRAVPLLEFVAGEGRHVSTLQNAPRILFHRCVVKTFECVDFACRMHATGGSYTADHISFSPFYHRLCKPFD